MEEEKNEKGFVIKDRRLFTEAGEAREDAVKESKTEQEEPQPSPAEKPRQEDEEQPFPEINFAGFLYSLITTAFYHFGDFPDPVTNKAARNLQAAKQTIDILAMLKDKTEGNLLPEEKKMLEESLYELRIRYVKEAQSK